MPYTAVRSLVIHPRDREVVVGTFGLSLWIGDVSVIEQLETAMGQRAFLFDVKPATAYNIRYTYGTSVEEVNGDAFFRGQNPPYGATISYYLREPVAGDVTVAVSDASGKVVRTLTGQGTAGLHHVQWNLETDAAQAQLQAAGGGRGGDRSAVTFSERQRKRRVAPGEYAVALSGAGVSLRKTVVVKAEGDDVRRVLPRK